MNAQLQNETNFHIAEIGVQIGYFFRSLELTQADCEILRNPSLKNRSDVVTRIFYSISNALGCAAIIHNFISVGKRKEKAIKDRVVLLRKILAIAESDLMILKRDPLIRHSFEHIDERIDRIIKGDIWSGGPKIDFCVDTVLPKGSVRRYFNPATGTIKLFSHELNLFQLRDEMHDLYCRVVARSKIDGGLPGTLALDSSLETYLLDECRLETLLGFADTYLEGENQRSAYMTIFSILYKFLRGDCADAINQASLTRLREVFGPLNLKPEFVGSDPNRLEYQLFAFEVQARTIESTGAGVWTERHEEYHRSHPSRAGWGIIKLSGSVKEYPQITDQARVSLEYEKEKRFPP